MNAETRDRFALLATATGRSMSELLAEAADVLEQRQFFEEFSAGYQRLRENPGAWAEAEAERETEAATLMDRSA